MFNTLSSYLWGSSATDTDQPQDDQQQQPASSDQASISQGALPTSPDSHQCHLKTRAADDEWVLVDTSRGNSPQRLVETGPLENLLIEHPSMSVYGPRGRQSSAGADSNDSDSSGEEDMAAEDGPVTRSAQRTTAMLRQPPRRPRAVAACAGLLAQVEANRSMQIVKQRQESRCVTRNKLSHSNKVSQYQNQNKRMRRKHYMLRPSGRSNNRRC